MDPLSITASILTLLSAITATVKTGKVLRNAPSEVQALLNSLADAQLIVLSVDSFLKDNYISCISQTQSHVHCVSLKLKLEHAKSIVSELESIVNNNVMHKPDGLASQRPGRVSWARARRQITHLSCQLEDARKQLYSDFGLVLSSNIRLDLKGESLGLEGIQQSQSLVMERLKNVEEGLVKVQSQQTPDGPPQDTNGARHRSRSSPSRDLLDPHYVDERVYGSLSTPASLLGTVGKLESTPIAVAAEYNFLSHHREVCMCACHAESTASLQGLLGVVFLGYRGIPLLTKSCTNNACQRQAKPGFTVTYYFPQWFFVRRMVSLEIQATAMSGLQARLRFPQVVSPLASIFYVAGYGTADQLRFLFDSNLASPFDIHADTGATPLHFAQAQDNDANFQYLLSQGADLDAKDHFGWSANALLWDGVLSGRVPQHAPIRHLCSYTNTADRLQAWQFTKLHKSVIKIQSTSVEKEIYNIRVSQGRIDDVDGLGATPLHWAAGRGDWETALLLLNHGANPNHSSSRGRRPLDQAASFPSSSACASLLLQYGASTSLTENQGRTALSLACTNGRDANSEIVALLLDHINPEIPDRTGKTALFHAAISNKTTAIRLLIDHPVDLDARDKSGYTALMCAVHYNQHEAARLLLESGCDSSVLDVHNRSVLHPAAQHSDAWMRTILMDAHVTRIDVEGKDDQGQTARDIFLSIKSRQRIDVSIHEIDKFLERFANFSEEGEEKWEDAMEFPVLEMVA
ncbi:hypothetical protein ACJZ2D_005449 [Fusarium nematophilum]